MLLLFFSSLYLDYLERVSCLYADCYLSTCALRYGDSGGEHLSGNPSHPSGSVIPSPSDIKMTANLK